ncbi:MAG TPA: DUF2130 domain-containing protein [Puia sp.]|uniref:DUF2130 domain-containing protein n=1 Tax=Puia sp. TaxID=2045100 RepID=UPI002CD75EF5|nr:DUF2130 domain-containing protein [Puia sp.]HVU97008.1 DUF2130 domain-containing protein [Puia sp.]
MPTEIKCPNCGHQFPMEEAVSEEYKKELRAQMQKFMQDKEKDFQRKQDEKEREYQKKQEEFVRREQELRSTLETNLRKSIGTDYENKFRLLENANKDNEEKLKAAREKELQFLKKEQELVNREAELELSIQRRLQDERNKLSKEIRDIEEQRIAAKESEFQLRLKEKDKQLEDQKGLIEEMRRKAEQGSMQLQGEVQELALEELLRSRFPFDEIGPVAKGVRGADCIQTVRNNFGQECGKIIYESKRTQSFSQDWVEKLKTDMRSQGAMVAVIVTQAMPKDLDRFGEINGVWVCTFAEVKALSHVLRDGIIRVFNAARSQENKGDKMHMLYDYLTSTEFSEQWKAIREGFLSMKQSIQKERDMMERLWKAREKQLEKVLLNAAHVRGSIEGIAGKDAIDVQLLDDADDLLDE